MPLRHLRAGQLALVREAIPELVPESGTMSRHLIASGGASQEDSKDLVSLFEGSELEYFSGSRAASEVGPGAQKSEGSSCTTTLW